MMDDLGREEDAFKDYTKASEINPQNDGDPWKKYIIMIIDILLSFSIILERKIYTNNFLHIIIIVYYYG